MEKKYEMTDETRDYSGLKLHRIRAVRDFGTVKCGDVGGWIETEENLSHEGNAWVYNDAKVFCNVVVSDNAIVAGNAEVSGNAQVCDNATVTGKAEVSGNAEVFGNATVADYACISDFVRVYENASVCGEVHIFGYAHMNADAYICSPNDYIVAGPIGSRDDSVTFFRTKDGGISVCTGCFSGSLDEFRQKVTATHGNNEHGEAYRAAANMAEKRIMQK